MSIVIPFAMPAHTPRSLAYVQQLAQQPALWNERPFTRACAKWFQTLFPHGRIWFTSSCTRALEVAAFLLGLTKKSEVILPSFTHPATANAFTAQGASLVFVDVVPNTMTMDAAEVARAITPQTRAIVAVHYGGMAPNMNALTAMSKQHNIVLIEDNAHGLGAYFQQQPLGSWGQMTAFSFERQKNISCGEGGALLIHNQALWAPMAQYAASGTNRDDFCAGKVPHYQWITSGSKIAPSEITMAYLYGALQETNNLTKKRRNLWNTYLAELKPLEAKGCLHLPHPSAEQHQHNAHLFFIRLKSATQRQALMTHLAKANISAHFHYSPLHISPMGQQTGRFYGQDRHTEANSQVLLRLPLHTALTQPQVKRVTQEIHRFFTNKSD